MSFYSCYFKQICSFNLNMEYIVKKQAKRNDHYKVSTYIIHINNNCCNCCNLFLIFFLITNKFKFLTSKLKFFIKSTTLSMPLNLLVRHSSIIW